MNRPTGNALTFALVLSLVGQPGGLLSASDPVPPLIQQLGDIRFERRVEAERELLRQGAAGLEIIEAGVHSKDPEIRQRSLRILNLLRKTAFNDQRERVRTDPWTVPPELAPGWEVYQSMVGDGWEARDFFVRMIDEERDLMLAVTIRPQQWTQDFERRCADLRTFIDRQPTRELQPLSVLTLLFLASHPDNKVTPFSAQTISALLVDSTFFKFVHSLPPREMAVCNGLLSAWIMQSGRASPAQRLDLANKFRLSAGLSAAQEIINGRNAPGASRVQLYNAIRFLSNYGTPDVMPRLEPLLNMAPVSRMKLDEPPGTDSISQQSQAAQDQQLGDLALLGLLQLTKQDPAAYGFVNVRIDAEHRYTANPPMFNKDEDRTNGLLKWKSWRTVHTLQFDPPPVDASEGDAA